MHKVKLTLNRLAALTATSAFCLLATSCDKESKDDDKLKDAEAKVTALKAELAKVDTIKDASTADALIIKLLGEGVDKATVTYTFGADKKAIKGVYSGTPADWKMNSDLKAHLSIDATKIADDAKKEEKRS